MKHKVKNIVLIGMPGVGKTTIGKQLANHLNREFIDMDNYIEQLYSMTIPEMFAVGEEFFRERETSVIRALSAQNNLIIATGGGVIKENTNIQLLKSTGLIFFLNRSVEDILIDLDAGYRPLLQDNPHAKLKKLYHERYDKYLACADYMINCPLKQIETAVSEISSIIQQNN